MSTARAYLDSLTSRLVVPLRTVKTELNKSRRLRADTVACRLSRALDRRKNSGIIQIMAGVTLASDAVRSDLTHTARSKRNRKRAALALERVM
jgi:hypothetical protein